MNNPPPCRFANTFAPTVIAMAFAASTSVQGLPATDLWLAPIVDGVYWTGNGSSL